MGGREGGREWDKPCRLWVYHYVTLAKKVTAAEAGKGIGTAHAQHEAHGLGVVALWLERERAGERETDSDDTRGH